MKNANNNIFTLKSYLQENIKSDFAPEIIEKVETIEKIISKNNLNELIEINNNVSQFIKKNNLISQSEIIAKQKEKDQQWVNQLIREGERKSSTYGVRGTPTVIIQQALKMEIGKYGSMDSFVKTLPETIEDLIY